MTQSGSDWLLEKISIEHMNILTSYVIVITY